MGKIVSTVSELVDAVQEVAGRGRILASVATPMNFSVYVPACKVQQTEAYLNDHCPHTWKVTVAPLYWQEHVTLWSTRYSQSLDKGAVTINTPFVLVRILQKLFKA